MAILLNRVKIDNTVRVTQCGSAHHIMIGDGRLCMQWLHAIVKAEPTGQLTHNSSDDNGGNAGDDDDTI